MSKKLPHKIDTEDLLKALESATDTTEFLNYKNDVPLFLSKFKIEGGKHVVPASVLYDLYKIYSADPVAFSNFSTSLSEFLPRNVSANPLVNISAAKIQKILNPQVNKNHISNAATQKHYDRFLEKEGITKGTKWVPSVMFHEIYRCYCIDNKVKARLSNKSFYAISKLNFEHRRIGSTKSPYFKLNVDINDKLSKEHQERITKRNAMSEEQKEIRRQGAKNGKKKTK